MHPKAAAEVANRREWLRSIPRRSALLLGTALLASAAGAPSVSGQEVAGRAFGRVVEAGTATPISAARVSVFGTDAEVETLRDGSFSLEEIPPGVRRLLVTRFGYHPVDTLVTITPTTFVRVAMRPRPARLEPITARASAAEAARAEQRALFDREPTTGLVGVDGEALDRVPALAEPDVIRSLQALPGVAARNELSAEIIVRGGAPDQTLFLLDGARVFAPYHMFGMFGTFNPDAVDHVDFYRGVQPARFGGGLSAVVDVAQRAGAPEIAVDAGLGLLAARATLRGPLPGVEGSWLLSGRRSHADVVAGALGQGDFPYRFSEAQLRVTAQPTPRDRLRVSAFGSGDDFRLFLGNVGQDVRSGWRNLVGSVQWRRDLSESWTVTTTAHTSGYSGILSVGDVRPRAEPGSSDTIDDASTENRVLFGGLRLDLERRADAYDVRFGLDLTAARAELVGSSEPGGYLEGSETGTIYPLAAYLEVRRELGRLRLSPGIRLIYRPDPGDVLVDPRLAARFRLTPAAWLTLGASRTHQLLSTLRDGRVVLPGPPLWFAHPSDAPPSVSDALGVELDVWPGAGWRMNVAAYLKRLQAVPDWRPIGDRGIEHVSYDDGRAAGLELGIRKTAGPVSGWLNYTYSRVRMDSDTHGEYTPPWDRLHAVDGTILVRVTDALELSGRFLYSTGSPFWAPTGLVRNAEFFPLSAPQYTELEEIVPIWGGQQLRLPPFTRADAALSYGFQVGTFEVDLRAAVLNFGGRKNVLYYELSSARPLPDGPAARLLIPIENPLPLTIMPSIGIDVRY